MSIPTDYAREMATNMTQEDRLSPRDIGRAAIARYFTCGLTVLIFHFAAPLAHANRDEKPEEVCASYFAAWKSKNWKQMAALTTKTWRNNEMDPAGTLKDWYDFRSLRSAKISHIERRGELTVDVTVKVTYKDFKGWEEHMITARMIKESAPHKPSPNGKWGVDPLSILKER